MASTTTERLDASQSGSGNGQTQIDQWATRTIDGVARELIAGNAGAALDLLNRESSDLYKQLRGSDTLYQSYRTEVEDKLKERGFIPDLTVAYAQENFDELDGNWRGMYPRRSEVDPEHYHNGVIDRTELNAAQYHNTSILNSETDPFGDVFASELGNMFEEIRMSDKETVDKIPIIGLGGHERDGISRNDLTKYLADVQQQRADAANHPGPKMHLPQFEATQAFLGSDAIFDILDDTNPTKRDGKISSIDLKDYLRESDKHAPYRDLVRYIRSYWAFPDVSDIRDGLYITRESFARGLGYSGPNELRVELARFTRTIQKDE